METTIRRGFMMFTAAAVLACQPARPSLGEWKKAWTEIQAEVPSEANTELCERLLGATRSLRDQLLPSPDSVLDPAVTDWLAEAGLAAAECSIAPEEKVLRSFVQLRELAAEVNAAIASGLVR